MAKYVGKIQNDKDIVNKKYVDSGLAGKAASSHSHPFYQVSIPTDYVATGGPDTISRFGIQETRACKTAFLPPEAITIEYTTDGGITWLDYGATDAQKRELVSCKYSGSFKYGGPSCTVATNKIGLRITLNPTDRYCYVNMAYMWVNIPGHTCNVFTEYSTIGAKTTFIKLNNGKTYNINGWSGGNMLYFPGGTFGGGASQTSNRYAYRFTYLCKSINETYKTAIPTVIDLRLYGTSTWNAPNNFMKLDHIYSWDANQNVTFPKNVTAPNFIGSLSGTANIAKKLEGQSNNVTITEINYLENASSNIQEQIDNLGEDISDLEVKVDNNFSTVNDIRTDFENQQITIDELISDNDTNKKDINLLKQQNLDIEEKTRDFNNRLNTLEFESTGTLNNGAVKIKDDTFSVSEGTDFNTKIDNEKAEFNYYDDNKVTIDKDGLFADTITVRTELNLPNLKVIGVSVNNENRTHIHWIGG